MRLVIQRVLEASVTAVQAQQVTAASSQPGLLVLVGLETADTEKDLEYCAKKLVNLKLWPAATEGPDQLRKQWQQSVADISGHILLVSQFTLYARTTKGTKPDFHRAMAGPVAQALFSKFVDLVTALHAGGQVGVGAFGEYMHVSLVNDGPVTIIVDSRDGGNSAE